MGGECGHSARSPVAHDQVKIARISNAIVEGDGSAVSINCELATGELFTFSIDAAKLEIAITMLMDAGAKAAEVRAKASGDLTDGTASVVSLRAIGAAISAQTGLVLLQMKTEETMSDLLFEMPPEAAGDIAKHLSKASKDAKAEHHRRSH